MSFRTVVISQRAKLDFQMNYLVVRGEEVNKVFLDDISTIIIETTAVSLTAVLVSECIKRKIKIIFCDSKRNPAGEIVPYYGAHNTSKKVREQAQWPRALKDKVWMLIIQEKIRNQRDLMVLCKAEGHEYLTGYSEEVELGDKTNREGLAAKIYFSGLFGKDFCRDDVTPINAALDYGYALLLSAFNREIVNNGYITQLGLFHDNQFNYYNLGSDLMEPFRPIVDKKVKELMPTDFGTDEKRYLLSIFDEQVHINNKLQY